MNTLEDAFINIGLEDQRYDIKIENIPPPFCFSKGFILKNDLSQIIQNALI